MNILIKNKKLYSFHKSEPVQLYLIIGLIVLSLFTGIFIVFSPGLLAIEIGIAVFFLLIVYLSKDFTLILLAIVIIRPLLSPWTEYRIGILGVQMAITISIISLLALYLLTNRTAPIKKILRDPFVLFFSLYILSNFISIAFNPKVALQASLSLTFRFVSFLAMYLWGIMIFQSDQKKDLAIASYIFASIPIAIVGYYQLFTGSFYIRADGIAAINSTFLHPNMYANFLILTMIASFYFILKKQNIKLNFILLVLNSFLFSQTYSRTAFFVGILVIFLLLLSYTKKSIYLIPLISACFAFVFYHFPSIIDTWVQRFSVNIHDTASFTSSRVYIFNALIYWFKQNPLLGIGPGTFCPYYYVYAQPHNELLRNLAEVGLLGTIPFVAFWLIIIKNFYSNNYFKFTREYNHQKFFIFLMIVSVIIISLTSNIGTKPELLWPLFILFGSYANQNKKKRARNDHHH